MRGMYSSFFPHKSQNPNLQHNYEQISKSLCTIVESPCYFEGNSSQLQQEGRPERRNTSEIMAHIKAALETIRETADGPHEMSIDELDCMLEQTLSLLSSAMDVMTRDDHSL